VSDSNSVETIDIASGKTGNEPFYLTAFKTGLYRLVVRTSDPKVQPGKYVMRIDRILTAGQNGQRMAEKSYPPAIRTLWRSYVTDPNAIENFLASRKGKGPIVEPLPHDSQNFRVTYVYYADDDAEKASVNGGPNYALGGLTMTRFLRTRLFFASEIVPSDARYRYSLSETRIRFAGPAESVQVTQDYYTVDPLNPVTFRGLSVLTMPAASPQVYTISNPSVPKGTLKPVTLKSSALHENRDLTIYTPPGYNDTKACDLLIVFDGSVYGGGPDAWTVVPTPTILDNLIAAKKINPTIAVLVPEESFPQRSRDLTGYAPFANFIGTEVVHWMRQHYRINRGADHVVVAGSSFGGFTASYCALLHSETIGNVLSQSGSYWLTKDWQTPSPYPYPVETGFLIQAFSKSPRLPIRFYMEVGRFDSAVIMVPTNRELRDILLVKGYSVSYHEFDGGHDSFWWRGSLSDGLISLMGRKSDGARKE